MNKVPTQGEEPQIVIGVSDHLDRIAKLHESLSHDTITVSGDRARLILREYLEKIASGDSWIAPLGIFLTLIVTLVTTTFRDVVLSADAWKALFTWALVFDCVWLLRSVLRAKRAPTIDRTIEALKGGSPPSSPQGQSLPAGTLAGVHAAEGGHSASITILSAVYGADGRILDLTDTVANLVIAGRAEIIVGNQL